jgi:hypothetical protein
VDQIASSTLSIGLSATARPVSVARPVDDAVRQLHEEWQAQQTLFFNPNRPVQRFSKRKPPNLPKHSCTVRVRLVVLPENVRVIAQPQSRNEMVSVPAEFRKHVVAVCWAVCRRKTSARQFVSAWLNSNNLRIRQWP